MCEKCGCAGASTGATPMGVGDAHAHGHDHPHGRDRLSEDDLYAERNRGFLLAKRVFGVNLVSLPGSNAGTLIARTAAGFAGRRLLCVVTVALLDRIAPPHEHAQGEGSEEPHGHTRDAPHSPEAGSNAPVADETRSLVDAHRLWHALGHLDLDAAELLLVENGGITETQPARDLGESARVALFTTRDGERKPLECPALFAGTHVVLIDVSNLAPRPGFDLDKARAHLAQVAPGATVFAVSPETGEGMQAWLDYLETGMRQAQGER